MKEFSARTLTAYYLTALLIVGGLSTVCHYVLANELRLSQRSASLINASGRQRMLSQRIASMAAQYRLGLPGAAADLTGTIAAFERGHRDLLAEVDASQADDPEATQLRAVYYRAGETSLDTQTQHYIGLARKIAATPAADPALGPMLNELFSEAKEPLLRDLDVVVTIRQQESERRIARLEDLQSGLLGLVLLTLMVEALMIFRPMVRRIVGYTNELIAQAATDPLTGVANRRSFMDLAARELSRARRYDRPLSLLIVDVDHFKAINDTQGHLGGDKALVALAEELARQLRTSDLLGRIGGEEFALLLAETDLATATVVAERLRVTIAAMKVPYKRATTELITISIGVAQAIESMAGISELMNAADLAMYKAKQAGRNCVVAI